MRCNELHWGHYFEPYTGGGGLALGLLFGGCVAHVHINDADPAIHAFWESIIFHTEEFLEVMWETEVTVSNWMQQREVYESGDSSELVKLGFSAFFLNRTNRSGIIRGAGCIGGKNQVGSYKIDCRFNKDELSRRIRRISSYRSQITLHGLDAVDYFDYVDGIESERSFCYIDPPYINKGQSLYANAYAPEDHKLVANRIKELRHPWILTYDIDPRIRDIYRNYRQFDFQLNYSTNVKRKGGEVLIPSKGLKLPETIKALPLRQPIRTRRPLSPTQPPPKSSAV